ncbi:uncharacterized protein EV154DRAFT_560551 [Mucor mucedo]|uniref:uncharacterized protein n=1 Tax=Mucor mucedo TaxID=29922 RepID=UPI00221F217F|nr:uncharacterized protein EV154DRAFT_560551 [Mucor mucedo]KAI7894320.1 hypothetical protein EV154DRAFT_560551 [Mucor mucedo]
MKIIYVTQAIPLMLALAQVSQAGPLAYAICQSGCNSLAVACYASAGSVFGTITAGLGTPAAILGSGLTLQVLDIPLRDILEYAFIVGIMVALVVCSFVIMFIACLPEDKKYYHSTPQRQDNRFGRENEKTYIYYNH